MVFPLAAILTAAHWEKMLWNNASISKWVKALYKFHLGLFLLFIVVVGVILSIPFGKAPIVLLFISLLILFLLLVLLRSKFTMGQKWFYSAIILWVGVNLVMNTQFYPNLLPYQLGNQMVKQISQKAWDKSSIVLHKIPNSYAMHFYGQYVFKIEEDSLQLKEGNLS